MTIALEDQLHDHPDMAALFEQKLAIEGASPKPCIVPGNALQLIDDDPAASRSHTPSSVIILEDAPHLNLHAAGDASADSSADLEAQRRPVPRVRFRSRVRITSGLRRSKHISGDAGGASPTSSASDSPSSSISAPLRWQADENAAWGPLGRRLSAYASQNGWQKQRVPSAGPRNGHGHGGVRPNGGHRQQPQPKPKMDERTPLVRSGRNVAYVDTGLDGGREADDERLMEGEYEDSDEDSVREDALRKAALKREEEAVFGPWPWRLFSRHVRLHYFMTDRDGIQCYIGQWWWWHVEPVLCCLCPDDSDYEG